MPEQTCEHSWRHLDTSRWTDFSGSYNTTFHRRDRFFCDKCLAIEDKAQTAIQRDTPDWYRADKA